jgi:hypothetical protein
MTTGADATAVAAPDGTTRGPDGSNESNPLPSARRFSAGLCSSTAAIVFSCKMYRDTIYFKNVIGCEPKPQRLKPRNLASRSARLKVAPFPFWLKANDL